MTDRQYATAGVDLEALDAAKRRIGQAVASTRTELSRGLVGAFGGMIRIPEGFRQPVLVMSTDSVGTKVVVAFDGFDAMSARVVWCRGEEIGLSLPRDSLELGDA